MNFSPVARTQMGSLCPLSFLPPHSANNSLDMERIVGQRGEGGEEGGREGKREGGRGREKGQEEENTPEVSILYEIEGGMFIVIWNEHPKRWQLSVQSLPPSIYINEQIKAAVDRAPTARKLAELEKQISKPPVPVLVLLQLSEVQAFSSCSIRTSCLSGLQRETTYNIHHMQISSH